MATDATGTPSTNWLIPKFLTSADAPSGKGLNAIVDYLDTLLKQKFPGFSSAITGTPSSTTYLRGDGSWATVSAGPGAPATTLPGSPTDGQQAILTDSTSAPTYAWLLQYSSAASKWLFIGGAPKYIAGTTTTTTGNTWPGVAVTGVSFVLPRAGDYAISHGFRLQDANDTDCWMSPDGAGITAGDAFAAVAGMRGGITSPGINVTPSLGPLRFNGLTAAGTVTWKIKRLQANNGTARDPWATIVPIAVT